MKLAHLAKGSTRPRVAHFSVRPTPESAMRDGAVTDAAALAAEIKAMMKQEDFRIKSVVAAVSGPSVVLRTITMAAMSLNELKKSIRYEAERYIPYSVDDAQIDGVILRPAIPGDEKNMEVLLMAAPRNMVRKTEDVIRQAGLVVQAIELEPVALLRLLRLAVPPETLKQTIAFINIGASATSINIINNGVLRSSRAIAVAGNSLTRALGQSLNLSFAEAEKLKKEKAILRTEHDAVSADASAMKIFSILLPVLTAFVTEIQRSFDFYRSRYSGESVDLVYLIGGGAHLKKIDHFLAGELGLHVETFDSFSGFDKESFKGLSEEKMAEFSPDAAVVLGLAGWHLA